MQADSAGDLNCGGPRGFQHCRSRALPLEQKGLEEESLPHGDFQSWSWEAMFLERCAKPSVLALGSLEEEEVRPPKEAMKLCASAWAGSAGEGGGRAGEEPGQGGGGARPASVQPRPWRHLLLIPALLLRLAFGISRVVLTLRPTTGFSSTAGATGGHTHLLYHTVRNVQLACCGHTEPATPCHQTGAIPATLAQHAAPAPGRHSVSARASERGAMQPF